MYIWKNQMSKIMKKLIVLLLTVVLPLLASGQGKIVVAYVGAGSDVIPEQSLMTHINYAFGHVNETFDGVRISKPERLRAIVKACPDVKVCLSVGGWGSGRFSEMAADENLRRSFAQSCAQAVKEYGLAGIDIDWEYPTVPAAGISSSPDDTENFTLLMKDLREAIGPDKLLTLATSASARFIDFKAILPVIDFVNVMSYDMGRPPRHNAPLYGKDAEGNRSPIAGRMNCHAAVQAHLAAGVPASKMTMGMPFYGHGKEGYNDYVDYKDMKEPLEGYEEKWDSIACVPYYANKEGRLVLGYDNPRSIGLKCKYIIDNDLLGGMYWEYSCDSGDLALARTVASYLMGL